MLKGLLGTKCLEAFIIRYSELSAGIRPDHKSIWFQARTSGSTFQVFKTRTWTKFLRVLDGFELRLFWADFGSRSVLVLNFFFKKIYADFDSDLWNKRTELKPSLGKFKGRFGIGPLRTNSRPSSRFNPNCG